MDLSILVARTIALIYLAACFAFLTGQFNAKKYIKSFEDSQGLVFITGIFILIVGMLLVEHHNIWEKDWRVLVTLMGWSAVIKGVWMIALPSSISMFKGWFDNIKLWAVISLVIGLVFGYFGFVA